MKINQVQGITFSNTQQENYNISTYENEMFTSFVLLSDAKLAKYIFQQVFHRYLTGNFAQMI